MTLGRYLFSLVLVLLLTGGLMYVMPPAAGLGWGIGWLVTLGVGCLYELSMARLERRPVRVAPAAVWILLLGWPLAMAFWLLMFYGLWAQPRWAARFEREERERMARMAANDATRTDRRCASCGKPVPGYRKTCRHCQQPFATPTEGDGAAAAARPRRRPHDPAADTIPPGCTS